MNLSELKEKYPLPFTLLDSQEEDISRLLTMPKALMDLPVGYGKTVIATYTALGHECDRILILVPPILIKQWARWLKAIPSAGEVLGYEGSIKNRKEFQIQNYRWLVASYVVYKNDETRLVQWLVAGNNPAIIVDECQNLKNSSSKLYRAVKRASDNFKVWLMTGTPLSSPMDAYAYIKIKTPTIYRNLGQFQRIHVEETDFFGSVTKWGNLDMLNSNLRLQCVYRDKADVHKHLKSRMWPIYYGLSPKHMKLYTQLMEEQLLLIGDKKIDATTAQKLYNAAQQIIINYDFFSGDEDARSNTYDLVDEVIDEIGVQSQSNSKLIIWTWFKKTTASITAYLANYGAVAAYSEVDSKKSVERFMEDQNCRILVAQPGSAGAGLNPQYVCSEALFLETPTRTIQFRQAAGRIDRMGQVHTANNRVAVANGTIQEKLFNNLMANDDLVTIAAGTKTSIRSDIFGCK